MATFYQTCIYLCFGLIAFNLLFNFVDVFGAFTTTNPDVGVTVDEGNVLSELTGLTDASMNGLWLIAVGGTGIAAIGLAWITHSITPVGIHLFSTVFWTAYMRTITVVNYGGYIPGELIVVFTVITLLLFVAAVIGMLTGSG